MRYVQPIFVLVMTFTLAGVAIGQTADSGKNNPYSPGPAIISVSENQPAQIVGVQIGSARHNENGSSVADTPTRPRPTDIYKIGVGDVLLIELKNAAQNSGYYTVRADGTIDYPLAGEAVAVNGHLESDVETLLRSRITLFADPEVAVKVRHYASHPVTVSGMVDNPGIKYLQREAVPLFVIKAEAGINEKASTVSVSGGSSVIIETYDLHHPSTNNVLIYPGSKIEFSGTLNGPAGSYFIGGKIGSAGQKPFSPGLTLFQAIIASGGETGSIRKAVIRRRNDAGTLTTVVHDLKVIMRGKAPDPELLPGDMIEIRN